MKQSNIQAITKKLGYTFKNSALLVTALTHRSVGATHNERLEFLGDTVLNIIISAALFKQYPNANEGSLSHMRSVLVCESQLVQLADDLDLQSHLQLAKSLKKQTGPIRPSLLANAVEAIIGAIYIDCETKLSNCEANILKWYEPYLAQLTDIAITKDSKTILQEYLQAKKLPTPHYHLVKQTGTGHEPLFEITCELKYPKDASQALFYTSTGKTRRQAEKSAAALALKEIKTLESIPT